MYPRANPGPQACSLRSRLGRGKPRGMFIPYIETSLGSNELLLIHRLLVSIDIWYCLIRHEEFN